MFVETAGQYLAVSITLLIAINDIIDPADPYSVVIDATVKENIQRYDGILDQYSGGANDVIEMTDTAEYGTLVSMTPRIKHDTIGIRTQIRLGFFMPPLIHGKYWGRGHTGSGG
jgi:hypothetical protein